MTIEKAYRNFRKTLESIYPQREANNIARIVFEDVFKIHDFRRQDHFSDDHLLQLTSIEKRLLNHEPVQYVLGFADFFGLKFKVDKNVLIPRQETEELVDWILEVTNVIAGSKEFSVLDIGTGSGCIPIVLKKKKPQWQIEALDVSPGALEIAEENAKLNNAVIRFFQLDILDETLWNQIGHYDLIVSNPPYITSDEQHLVPKNVLVYEPRLALFVETDDPLLFYKKISSLAFSKLKKDGKLFFELNEFHAEKVLDLVKSQGFSNIQMKQDMSGKNRMLYAEK